MKMRLTPTNKSTFSHLLITTLGYCAIAFTAMVVLSRAPSSSLGQASETNNKNLAPFLADSPTK